MPQIKQVYKIHSTIQKVWDALVNPITIEKWGGGPNIIMDITEGGHFSLWNGDIYGTNTLVVTDKLLKQDWYGGKWEKPSKVIFELSFKDEITTLLLSHDNLPPSEVKDFQNGWKDYYLGPIKNLLEAN